MAILSKTIMQRAPVRNTFKIVSNASLDTATCFINKTVTLGSLGTSLVFNLATSSGNGGTIIRQSGSWVTDFTDSSFAGGGGMAAVGQYVFNLTASNGSAQNFRQYNLIGFTTTTNAFDTAIVSPFTPVRVAETATSFTTTAYYSDIITSGQTLNLPKATSTGSAGGAGAMTFTVSSATGITVGQYIYGANILNGTVVTNVSGTTITTSMPCVGTVSSTVKFFSGPAPTCNISKIWASVNPGDIGTGELDVLRNSTVVIQLFDNDGYGFVGSLNASLNENNTSDIVFNWLASADGGTTIFEIVKIDGFSTVDTLTGNSQGI